MSTPAPTTLDHLLGKLRFRHLQLLVMLHEHGSLISAARKLHATQPALSKALAELESMLGFALFERTVHGLKPTSRGHVMMQGARYLIEGVAHLRSEALHAEPTGQPATVLRIGMSRFLATMMLAPLAGRLSADPAPVRILVREGNTAELLEDLRNGQLDALISILSVEAARGVSNESLHYQSLGHDDVSVIVHPSHALAGRRAVPWSRLQHERWIAPAPPSVYRMLRDQSFMEANLIPPEPVIESDSPITNARLVARGLGIGFVPGVVMRDAQAAGAVRSVGLLKPMGRTAIGMVCHAAALSSPRIGALRRALEDWTALFKR